MTVTTMSNNVLASYIIIQHRSLRSPTNNCDIKQVTKVGSKSLCQRCPYVCIFPIQIQAQSVGPTLGNKRQDARKNDPSKHNTLLYNRYVNLILRGKRARRLHRFQCLAGTYLIDKVQTKGSQLGVSIPPWGTETKSWRYGIVTLICFQ